MVVIPPCLSKAEEDPVERLTPAQPACLDVDAGLDIVLLSSNQLSKIDKHLQYKLNK